MFTLHIFPAGGSKRSRYIVLSTSRIASYTGPVMIWHEPKQRTYRVEIMDETSSASSTEVRHVDLLVELVFEVDLEAFLEESGPVSTRIVHEVGVRVAQALKVTATSVR
jgi:hypothetical protein